MAKTRIPFFGHKRKRYKFPFFLDMGKARKKKGGGGGGRKGRAVK